MSSTWHSRPVAQVVADLETTPAGLSHAEAARRLQRYGENRLLPPRPVSALKILRDQLASVVVLLLLAAAVVSLLLGDRLEAAAVGAVLAINALIGFVTELRARRAMEALLQYQAPRASVVREGRLQIVGAEALVPGDVVQLTAGQAVPADGRLIEVTDLRTVEAALTGESLPVSKTSEPVSLQLAALYVDPLPRVLRVTPLPPHEWAVVLGCAAAPAVVGQAVKLFSVHRRSQHL